MKFLDSPAAFVGSIILGILAFGIGLTSPIWLLLEGKPPVEAMHAGTPIVIMTIIGMIVMVALGVIAQRFRKPSEKVIDDDIQDGTAYRHKDVIVHLVTMAMFLVPFATIIIGMMLRSVIDADSTGHF